jgi:hypothetical protein
MYLIEINIVCPKTTEAALYAVKNVVTGETLVVGPLPHLTADLGGNDQ